MYSPTNAEAGMSSCVRGLLSVIRSIKVRQGLNIGEDHMKALLTYGFCRQSSVWLELPVCFVHHLQPTRPLIRVLGIVSSQYHFYIHPWKPFILHVKLSSGWVIWISNKNIFKSVLDTAKWILDRWHDFKIQLQANGDLNTPLSYLGNTRFCHTQTVTFKETL